MKNTEKNLKERIRERIVRFVDESRENSLRLEHDEKAFGTPLVGFSRGDDPLYQFLKKDIGDFYWHPIQAFSAGLPNVSTSADRLAVISWVLPQTERTRQDHRKETSYPSERWTRVRLFGEAFNNKLREFVTKFLNDAGHLCVAPTLLPEWEKKTSETYGYASKWSERHTAFVSGLGTFGLSDGLITPLGKAVRFGSVIVKADIRPTERAYASHNEYCLYHQKGKCRKCAERCPANAISEKGHDKVACKQYIRSTTSSYAEKHHGFRVNSCGLCQTGVPCESRIPLPRKKIS